MNNKIIIGIIVGVVALSGAWYISSRVRVPQEPGMVVSGQLETTKVKIANLPVVQGLPLYLAIEKGYFKDAGLEVELVKFEAPNQIIDALLQGQVDLTSPSGAMGITGIADFKNPGKLKIYAAGGGDNVIQEDAILVRNDSSIKTISELRGKKLGIIAGSIQWRTIAKHILAKNNLVADQDVTLVELAVGLQAQALASGQIDALLALEPIPTVVKVKNIGTEIISNPTVKYIGNPFYSGAGIIRTEFIRDNPNTTRKILSIFDRAIGEINRDPNSARQYLKGYTPLDDEVLGQVPINRFRMYSDLSATEEITAVQKFYDIFSNFKVVDGKMDFQKLLYSPNVN